jgi:hypothetical protein
MPVLVRRLSAPLESFRTIPRRFERVLGDREAKERVKTRRRQLRATSYAIGILRIKSTGSSPARKSAVSSPTSPVFGKRSKGALARDESPQAVVDIGTAFSASADRCSMYHGARVVTRSMSSPRVVSS